MSACRGLERPLRVAFLGPWGTFSEQAMRARFGDAVEGVPCASIDDVFRVTEAGTVDFGVVPIENSTEGSVTRTQDLFLNTPLRITAEITVPGCGCQAIHERLRVGNRTNGCQIA